MASLSTTELNATIDEKWDQEVLEARYNQSVIMPRVNNKSAIVAKSGDIIHMTVGIKLSSGTVGSNGAFTPTAITPTSVPITIDTNKYVSLEIEDQAQQLSFYDPTNGTFPKYAGKVSAEDYDGSLAGLWSDLTSSVVGDNATGDAFDDTIARAAMLKLRNLNVPVDDLSFILPPVAIYNGIMAQPQFTDASKVGMPKSVLTTNYRFPLLGTPVYESTLLKTPAGGTSTKAFLLHKEAFAIAMAINNKYKRAERTASLVLSSVVVMNYLYGFATIRQNHACVINVKST